MKIIITTIAVTMLLFTSCNVSDTEEEATSSNVPSPDEKQAIIKQFEDVTSVEVWRKVDGMNSTPIVIEDESEIKDFYNLIGTKIEKKPDCNFNAGITFEKENGDMIFAKVNYSDDCQTISYFNTEGEMEHHTFTKKGIELFKATVDKIDLPN
jgi:hypothetical protein